MLNLNGDQRPALLGEPEELVPSDERKDRQECLPAENNYNGRVNEYGRQLIRLLDLVKGEIVRIERGNRKLQPLLSAIRSHDNQIRVVHYSACFPSGPIVERTFDRQRAYVAELIQRGTQAVDGLFRSFKHAVEDAEDAADELKTLRAMFDTTESLPRDIQQQFDSRIVQFHVFRQTCETFDLSWIRIGASVWDPADLKKRLADSINVVAQVAVLSELDYLRFEYAQRGLLCPLPGRFSQGKRSVYFSHAELNKGTYSWALLPDGILTLLDTIYVDMKAKGYPVQLNSFYRNPAHNDNWGGVPNSLHQYGRAADLQTFDFDGSNAVDETDWKLLESVVKSQSPAPVIEPIQLSGVGHVHAEWH